MSLDQGELDLLRANISRLINRRREGRSAAEVVRGSEGLWRQLASLGLAGAGRDCADIRLLLPAMEEMGAALAPLPLIGAAIANRLLGGREDAQDLLGAVAAGEARIAVAFAGFDGDRLAGHAIVSHGRATGVIAGIEDLELATHVLVLTKRNEAALLPIEQPAVGIEPMAGFADPPLARVALDGAACTCWIVECAMIENAADLARLLLTARAWGAMRRGLAMATDYAATRQQFGQPIGRFQAIQHKLADCRVRLALVEALLRDAGESYMHSDDVARSVATLLSVASPALRRNALEIEHVFGAVGFADEHEAARLFCRVHADTVRLGGVARARRLLAERLRDRGDGDAIFASPREPDERVALRRNVRIWLEQHWGDAALRDPGRNRDFDAPFLLALSEAGWLTANWPVEHGGPGFDAFEQFALLEELRGGGAPMTLISPTHWIVGPAIIANGSEELKARVLPEIASGRMTFALGYSEPQAGSDLAALATRAVREGDDYVVNGQKIWTSNTEYATHLFLALRTGAESGRKQDGISVLIVPIDAPGIPVQRTRTLHGKTFASVFLDDVRVPANMLVGAEGQGWKVVTAALGAERIIMGGQIASMRRLFAALVPDLRRGEDETGGGATWETLAGFAAELEGARALSLRSVERVQEGGAAILEGAIAKLYSGDLAERLCEMILDLCGVAATLDRGVRDALLDGEASTSCGARSCWWSAGAPPKSSATSSFDS